MKYIPDWKKSCSYKKSYARAGLAMLEAQRLSQELRHDNIRAYICFYCGKYHIGHISPKHKRYTYCDQCGTFILNKKLDRHTRHQRISPYEFRIHDVMNLNEYYKKKARYTNAFKKPI